MALEDERHEKNAHDQNMLEHVRRLHEHNPMLGLRGVRRGTSSPACSSCRPAPSRGHRGPDEAGGDPQPEIMVPLVVHERSSPWSAPSSRR